MSIVQVAQRGPKFVVLDGQNPVSHHDTRGEAVKAALAYKENHS